VTVTLSRRSFLTVPAATAGALAVAGVRPRPARAAVADLYAALDDLRLRNGLPPLQPNSAIASVAQNWTISMVGTGVLAHNPSYSTQIPPGWNSAGENVGWAYSDSQLHDAWVGSAGHLANMISPNYTSVGMGRVQGVDYRIWGTQDFGGYQGAATGGATPGVFGYRTAYGEAAVRAFGNSLGPEVNLGGQLLEDPTVVTRGGGVLEVYGRGTNGRIYTRSGTIGGAWSAWASIGAAVFTSAPAALYTGGAVHLYLRDEAGALARVTSASPGVFAAPERIGGYLLDGTGPAVATDAGQPVVAVLGGNRALYTIAHGATTFTGLGVTAITVNNRALFIVRGTNGAAYSHGNVPGNWFKIGGVMISAPLSATSSTGMPTLFVVGGNGRMYSHKLAPMSSPWAIAF
jgi:hypothetical protein